MRLFYIFTGALILFINSSEKLNAQCVGTYGEVSWHYWDNLPFYGLDHLYVDDTYPAGPDIERKLNALSIPVNYKDNYGCVTKGFISVPASGNVTFNVTGDDYTYFFLSTNDQKENLQSIAFVPEWTQQQEYDKFPEQTSSEIYLTTDQYYYFELHHREGSGGDHASVHWKTSFIDSPEWKVITFQYLYDTCEQTCPKKGTICDDNNSTTTDDIEDGYCNCVGSIPDTSIPLGERSILKAYFYPGVPDGNLSALYTHPDYPMMPSEMNIFNEGLFSRWNESKTDYGIRIQGYLTVPVDGCYDFNLTGVNEVKFYLSSDKYEENKNANIIETRWGTNRLNHDVPEFEGSQTVEDVCLSANTYYYFEVEQVTSTWGHFFNVFWKGPHHYDDHWHMIPELYVYDYTDEKVCLPQASLCNDNDPLTANDQIDNNCECTGTPCNPGVDCDDPTTAYVEYDYCKVGNELGTRADDSWLSCNPSTNPYMPERSGYHWIHYDLGKEYVLGQTHVWNYNVPGYTYQGIQQVAVDYSIDGSQWHHHGTYNWPIASGTNSYTGFQGPNFDGMIVRYVMFTSLDDSSICRGLSKVTFSAEECPSNGSPCDDNDPLTFQDAYKDCICTGIYKNDQDCAIDTIIVYDLQDRNNEYHAISALISEGNILSEQDVHYKAGVDILLKAGYEVNVGATFTAEVTPCQSTSIQVEKIMTSQNSITANKTIPESLDVFPLAGNTDQTIRFNINKGGLVSLDILDLEGNLVHHVFDKEFSQFGKYYKRIQTKKLENGLYMLRLQSPSGVLSKKISVSN